MKLLISLLLVGAIAFAVEKESEAASEKTEIKESLKSKLKNIARESKRAKDYDDAIDESSLRHEDEWIIIQERNFAESTAFAQNGWQEYKEGFGTNSTEYWLGLEKIHQLTKSGEWQLIIRFTLNDKREVWILYDGFHVEDEQMHYLLSVEKVSAQIGSSDLKLKDDIYMYFNRMPFATRDRRNAKNMLGISGKACGVEAEGGWWFRYCSYICPNCNTWIYFGLKKSEIRDTFVGMRSVKGETTRI